MNRQFKLHIVEIHQFYLEQSAGGSTVCFSWKYIYIEVAYDQVFGYVSRCLLNPLSASVAFI